MFSILSTQCSIILSIYVETAGVKLKNIKTLYINFKHKLCRLPCCIISGPCSLRFTTPNYQKQTPFSYRSSHRTLRCLAQSPKCCFRIHSQPNSSWHLVRAHLDTAVRLSVESVLIYILYLHMDKSDIHQPPTSYSSGCLLSLPFCTRSEPQNMTKFFARCPPIVFMPCLKLPCIGHPRCSATHILKGLWSSPNGALFSI